MRRFVLMKKQKSTRCWIEPRHLAVSHACVFHFLCSDPVAFDVGTVIAFLSDAVPVCCLSPNLYETDSLIARRFAEEGEVGRTAIF